MPISRVQTLSIALLAAATPASVEAQTVIPFTGIVLESCVLTVSTPGVLAMSSSGTELGSQASGGVAAVLGVVATGGAPTVKFTAPTMSVKPAAYAGSSAVSLAYTSTGGANQAYTTAASQYTASGTLDAVTLHAKAVDASGFAAGNYTLRTTATCEQ